MQVQAGYKPDRRVLKAESHLGRKDTDTYNSCKLRRSEKGYFCLMTIRLPGAWSEAI